MPKIVSLNISSVISRKIVIVFWCKKAGRSNEEGILKNTVQYPKLHVFDKLEKMNQPSSNKSVVLKKSARLTIYWSVTFHTFSSEVLWQSFNQNSFINQFWTALLK